MSRGAPEQHGARNEEYARIFSALGDRTRLRLLNALSDGRPQSISALAQGSGLSRQAITKHLNVLDTVGLVHGEREGRTTLYVADLRPFRDIQDYLDYVSREWDSALTRLKGFVED